MATHSPRRRSFTVETKLEIIHAVRNEPIHTVAKRFNVRVQQIQSWQQQEQTLLHQPATSRRIPGGGRPARHHSVRENASASATKPGDVLIGFVGQEGSFAEVAARKMFLLLHEDSNGDKRNVTTVGFSNLSQVMCAIENEDIAYGVIPRNELTSSVLHGTNHFISRRVEIVSEAVLRQEECLCTLPNVQLDGIDTILSDASTLNRCDNRISELENDTGVLIVRQSAWDSSSACEFIKQDNNRNIAVIATKHAARHHGLKIQSTFSIEPSTSNSHFIVAAINATSFLSTATNDDKQKSSILFAIHHECSNLSRIFSVFSDHDTDVTSIVTSPEMSTQDIEEPPYGPKRYRHCNR